MATAPGLVGLPAVAGQLARRWPLAPIDLTLDSARDGDAYAESDELPRGRLLLGLSLLSADRMRECLGRLNRGRDRIHALGLHVVIVIDQADLRAVHELAPDLASRVHEIVSFDVEGWRPAKIGVLSPLGPVARPQVHPDVVIESELVDALSGLGARVTLREAADPSSLAAAVGWRLAEAARARVAWIERGRWDDARCMQWLDELGLPRLLIVFGDGDERFDVRSSIASRLRCPISKSPVSIDLLPDATNDETSTGVASRPVHGMIWLLRPVEVPTATALGDALGQRGLILVTGPSASLQLRAAAHDDVAIVWLSPETLCSPELMRTLDALRPRDGWRPLARTIIVLDRIDNAEARRLFGPLVVTLAFTSPEQTADDIARLLHVPSTSRRLPHRGRPVSELAIALVESGTQMAVRRSIAMMTSHVSQQPFQAPCPDGLHDELSWYLGAAPDEPQRAQAVEQQLDDCARALSTLLPTAASEVIERVAVEFDHDSPPTWHRLAWELLAATFRVSVVRRLTASTPEPPRHVHEVLRVLVACWHEAAAEVIEAALVEIGPHSELCVLIEPTVEELAFRLADAHDRGAPYQLLHVHGHVLHDPVGFVFGPSVQPRVVSSADLAWSLQDRGLEVCIVEQSPMRPEQLAGDLLRVGIASVVTTRAKLAPNDRQMFLARVYGTIAAGQTIEAAVHSARAELREHGNVRHAWLAPLLFATGFDSPQLLPAGLLPIKS